MQKKRSRFTHIILFLFSFLFGCGGALATSELPQLGTAAVTTLSIDEEKRLGAAYMKVLRGQLPIIHDPVMTEYINELGNKLVAHSSNVRTPFHFFLVRDGEINAFAFFGGHVGIHSGLFNHADSESELASVMAHEVAHVTQRHLARAIEAQQRSGPTTFAGVLGSILLTIAAPHAGIAALQTTLAVNQQGQINYTRSHELEADRIGMQALVSAGFDPTATPSFFGKLVAQYRYTSKPPAMLLTHPLPESRVADTRVRAASYPKRQYSDNPHFHLAKARIRARYSAGTPEQKAALFERQLKQGRFTDAAKYGLALTRLSQKAYSKAGKLITELYAKEPQNLFYLDTYTDLLLATDKAEEAINLLNLARQSRPANGVIELNLANAYLAAQKPEQARFILERHRINHRDDMVTLQLLDQTYQALQMKTEQHQIRAETLALKAEFDKAIDQLQYAFRLSADKPLMLARIDARIKQLQLAAREKDQL